MPSPESSAAASILFQFIRDRITVADFLGWEAERAFTFDLEAKRLIDPVALLAEEVADGLRAESELRDAVARALLQVSRVSFNGDRVRVIQIGSDEMVPARNAATIIELVAV